MNNLARRGAIAAAWNYGGNLTRVGLQFGIGVLLARLIGPEGFGVVAITLAIISLGQIFVDFGFNAAIVQTRDLKASDVASLGTLQILVASTMTIVMYLSAGQISRFYHQPGALHVIQAMSLMFVIRGFGQTSVALLSRELKFRSVQLGSISGYVTGYILVGVPMAFSGYGPWSLVAAQLVQTFVSSVLAILQVGQFHRISVRGIRRDMLLFGQRVLSANVGSWTLVNVDSVVVGHVLGSTPLALYNRAFTLANTPAQAVLSGLQGVLFAATSRAQDNPEGCRRAFYTCVELFTLMLAPILLTVALTPRTVLQSLYGPEWSEATDLLPPLCIAAVIGGILGFFGPIIMGLGRIEKETRAQWMAAIIMVPTVYTAAHWSALAVAWSIVVIYLIRAVLLYRALDSILSLDHRRVLVAAVPGGAAAVIAASAGFGVDQLAQHWPLFIRLFAIVGAAGLGALVGLLACFPMLRSGALGSAIRKSNMLPPWVADLIGLTRSKPQDTIRSGDTL